MQLPLWLNQLFLAPEQAEREQARANRKARKEQVQSTAEVASGGAEDHANSSLQRDKHVVLPVVLTAKQRAAVHGAAAKAALAHSSSGHDASRRLHLGDTSCEPVRC